MPSGAVADHLRNPLVELIGTLVMPPPGIQRSVEPIELPGSLLRLHQSWDQEAIFDVVVIGAGIAGLAFTLRLPEGLRVALVTKGALGESNTRYAQGGLAAAMGTDDSPELHFADTMAAGAGLCDPSPVRALVERGPSAVRWLLARGTRFDADGRTTLALGREAAHSRRRVLHAGGDATGAEIERALVARVRARPGTDVLERTTALDLILGDERCVGAIVRTATGATHALRARTTVLANGGAGQLWAVTSNPPAATGDGIAIALRAGVAVADLEFTQFHPTVLDLPNVPPFLISEAVRGEGAYLRNRAGERFMVDDHALAELAPRDVVARAIQRELAGDGSPSVWLDLRHLDPSRMAERFPTIAAYLLRHGLDLTRDLVPVAPAAHYFMGGIVAGTAGETSLPGLLALGEVACTGVHGANRLASNSLLEGLVFGLDAADRLAQGDLPDLVALRRPHPVAAGPDGHDHTGS
ncbi:MAG: L-aspartate oxidase, partial [Chloroflexota bacterium]|nr:L-aspartate oxidase [Chloroflexota bacterium]